MNQTPTADPSESATAPPVSSATAPPVSSVAASPASSSIPARSPNAPPIVLGYYPSWESGLPPDKINFRQFTHLCHAFVAPDHEGNVKTGGNLPSRELTSLAHRHGVKVLLSLGGMDSGEVFAPLLRDRPRAEQFIQAVVAMVLDYDYDGVDLDWEFPADKTDEANLTWMAGRFRVLFNEKKPEALIATAQPGVDWAARWVNADALRDVFDFVAVMTYDMHGPWTGHAGFNAPLLADPKDRAECRDIKSFPAYMDYWRIRKDLSKSKLVVGVPCYGRGFPVSAWYESFTRADKPAHSYVAFREIPPLLADGWTRHWDEDTETPWLSKPGVRELITYDDEESAALKGRWAAENGYAGLFVWEISQDFVNGEHALVRAATEGYEAAARK